MPPDTEYTLQDLAELADVTPRTIRYYIAQGLLPSPGRAGPGTTYTESHLNRLRLIRMLQREHLPLAEIRARLASLDDASVEALVEAGLAEPPPGSAVDYIRRVLGGEPERLELRLDSMLPPGPAEGRLSTTLEFEPPASPAPGKPGTESPVADRSQWDRVHLAPDVELHVRRPLSRQQNKRVERLIAIARELLEEDQP
jgi:DNA-binding transcriptional MerR regulator